ncbi:MAG: glycosyltransferase family 39 protein [Chloroflexi bacterium]|nr:glycosyltransferase family 39 protein [Chloroflexota bacterium]
MQLSSAQSDRVGAARLTVQSAVPLVAVGLGLLLAVASGAIAASRGFDGLYGQDAYAYFDYSTGSVRQSILHLAPLEPFFWPPGYPLLVAIASLVVGPVALAGQLVSLLMGALVPVLTALLVRELWPDDFAWALLAGGMVAVCGQLWQSSVVVMADTTGLALATFSALALVRYARARHWAWLLAASAAIAYATLARWIYGLVALPLGVYALMVLLESRRVTRGAVVHACAALAVAGLILVPAVAQPLFGLIRNPGQPAAFAGNFQVYSWSPLNALRRDFFTADGHLAYAQPNGVYYAVAPVNPAYFGPLLAVWILPGLWAARRWPVRNIVLIVGWAAIVYAFHAGAPWQNFRFTLAYLPPLAVLAAAGILLAWRWVQASRRPLRVVVAGCVGIGLLISAGAAVRLVERFIDTKDQELTLVHWVQSQTPTSAELFSFGPTLAFRHYSATPTFDLFDLSSGDVRSILTDQRPHYLLVDIGSVETQWLGQAPSTNFHLLRDEAGLTELGTAEGYTLYQIAR